MSRRPTRIKQINSGFFEGKKSVGMISGFLYFSGMKIIELSTYFTPNTAWNMIANHRFQNALLFDWVSVYFLHVPSQLCNFVPYNPFVRLKYQGKHIKYMEQTGLIAP